jgi:hypothetical protein
MLRILEREGVLVAGGKSFKVWMEGKGWVRITFSVPEKVLIEGLRRVERCLFSKGESKGEKRKRCVDANEDLSEVSVVSKRIIVG